MSPHGVVSALSPSGWSDHHTPLPLKSVLWGTEPKASLPGPTPSSGTRAPWGRGQFCIAHSPHPQRAADAERLYRVLTKVCAMLWALYRCLLGRCRPHFRCGIWASGSCSWPYSSARCKPWSARPRAAG